MDVPCQINSINFKAGGEAWLYYGAAWGITVLRHRMNPGHFWNVLTHFPFPCWQDMTREQIGAEKVALQKALLYYESIHGRPVSRPLPPLLQINTHKYTQTHTDTVHTVYAISWQPCWPKDKKKTCLPLDCDPDFKSRVNNVSRVQSVCIWSASTASVS